MLIKRKYGKYFRDKDFDYLKDTGCLTVYSKTRNSGLFRIHYVNTRVRTLDYYYDDERCLRKTFYISSPSAFWECVNDNIQNGKKVTIDFSECDCFYAHLFYAAE